MDRALFLMFGSVQLFFTAIAVPQLFPNWHPAGGGCACGLSLSWDSRMALAVVVLSCAFAVARRRLKCCSLFGVSHPPQWVHNFCACWERGLEEGSSWV